MKAKRIAVSQLKILLWTGICFVFILCVSRLTAPEEILSSYDVSVTGTGIWVLLFLLILCAAELCWFFRDAWRSFFRLLIRERKRWIKEVIFLIASGAVGAAAGVFLGGRIHEEYREFWIMMLTVGLALFVLQMRLLFRKAPALKNAAPVPKDTLKRRALFFFCGMILLVLLILYEWAESTRLAPELGRVAHFAAPFAIALAETVILGFLFWKYVGKRQENEIRYAKLFFLILLILAAGYMFVMLPFVSPDEWHHYLSAYRISDLFLGRISPDSGCVLLRAGDYAFFNGYQINNCAQYFAQITGEARVFAEGSGYELLKMPMATNAVIGYFPSALGITVARLLHLGAVPTFFLGRFMNILVCTGILSGIMRMIPAFRNTLFSIAALPMMLHLMASYSYDGLTFVITALFVVTVIKIIMQDGPASARDKAGCLIAAALMAPAKFIYIPLILLVLLIPAEKLGSSRKSAVIQKLVFILIVILAILLTVKANDVLASYSAAAKTAAGQVQAGGPKIISWFNEEGYTLKLMIENAGDVIWMILRTFVTKFSDYVFTMGGVYLGWMSLGVPYACILLSYLMLFVSAHTNSTKIIAGKISGRKKVLIVILILVVIASIMVAMTYSWTPLSSEYVEGVQGRYFLPLLLLIPMLVQKGFADTGDGAMKYIAYFTALLNGWILVHTYAGSIMVYL